MSILTYHKPPIRLTFVAKSNNCHDKRTLYRVNKTKSLDLTEQVVKSKLMDETKVMKESTTFISEAGLSSSSTIIAKDLEKWNSNRFKCEETCY